MSIYAEGEQVIHLDEQVIGTVDHVREHLDPDTDRVIGETSYDVAWSDGNYSTHLETELVALSEG